MNASPNDSQKVHVKIAFCGSWGYGPKMRDVKQALLAVYPQAVVEDERVPGSTGCFEVTVNGQLVHSKLAGQGFVTDKDAFLQKVAAVVNQTSEK